MKPRSLGISHHGKAVICSRLARQQVTLDLWDLKRSAFTPLISGLVLQEAARGDPQAALMRLQACEQADSLQISLDAQSLGQRLMDVGAVPHH